MIKCNPQGDLPKIDKSAYVDPIAVIIGKVKIGKNVLIAPSAVIRADEPGSSIVIEDNCNVQDRVIIHALKDSLVLVRKNTSLAHGCIIHGPCEIGKNCFIGFGSVVFDAQIGDGVIIKHLSCIEKVKILSGKVITSGRVLNNPKDAEGLRRADESLKDFAKNVVKVNLDLVKKYKKC